MEALEEEIKEESNLVEFKQPKAYSIRPFKKVAHLFNQPEYLLQIVDLYLNIISDRELFNMLQSLVNLPISYPKGFNREFAIGVIDTLKTENPALLASYGLGLIQKYAEISKDIGFVFKHNQIHCMFMFHEDEPQHSGYIIIALRGTQQERARAGATFLKLWHNEYQKHWYDKGYRYIWANSFTQKGKDFIRHAGAKEPSHVFFSRQANQTVRYNGKYPWLHDYRWDLEKKYGS